ncbi:MAG: 5'-nucleotidase [uncultured Nocardioidaceae bacterium]|uniref:5'-nucleotidase n=1 Tax=uncultured Nocardioidaceae bacterium TaxID=253824 RepID=A0A6J4M7V9_9ACTN|nr:MAG: 5'-nucleotidase [uncultured Nocardioidaceae bacterium]
MPRPSRPLVALSAAVAVSLGFGSTAFATDSTSGTSGTSGQASYARTAQERAVQPVKIDLLALNDFHGNLEVVPPTSSSGRINNTPAGGAAYLASLLREERAKSRAAGAHPLTVAAGDLIGGSPLLSAAFHDEPSIKALNRMRLQVASVGNHEFDEGWRELRRMQRGGCIEDGAGADGQDSCPEGQGFAGAKFRYLAANVKFEDPAKHGGRETVFPATKVLKVGGVKVGFIGMTLEDTPSIVAQAGIKGLRFTDEVRTANKLVPQLKARGVQAIVVLLHEGVTPTDSTAYNDCTGVSGPALDISTRLRPAIDAVVSGHTHQPYNCVVDDPAGQPRLLTSAASFGRMVTKLHLLVDPRSGDVIRPAEYAENLIVENGDSVTPHNAILGLIETYTELVAPIRDAVIGHIAPVGTPAQVLTEETDPDGRDSPLGNLIADAQKADPSAVPAGGEEPVVALMNPGGIRADLIENEAGDITYGAAFTVQPFNNFVVSMDLTGEQIRRVLNQQWNGENEGDEQQILQVSGLEYTWDESDAAQPTPAGAEEGPNALVGDVLIDADGDPGTPLVPLEDATTYRVVMNNFLADGGDNFTVLPEGTNRYVGGLDIDSLVAYLEANDPIDPDDYPTDRISSVD